MKIELPKEMSNMFESYLVGLIDRNSGDIARIAKHLDVSYRTIYRWLERFDLLGYCQEKRGD